MCHQITKSSKIHRLDEANFSLINIRTFRRKSTFSYDLRKVGGIQEQKVQIRLPVHHAKSVSSICNKVGCNAFIGPEGGEGHAIIMG